MPELHHDSVRLYYEVHGEARGEHPPVILLHGGVSSFDHTYAQFGWVEALTVAGLRVVGLDFRGHGNSERPHDPACYGTENLAGDVRALLDHLGLQRVSLIAYSIGTAVAMALMLGEPARFARAALVATGDGLIGHAPHTFDALLPQMQQVFARDAYPRDLPKHQSAYWNILEQIRGDREAMRAMAGAAYPPFGVEQVAQLRVPTLVVSGAVDPVLGRGPRLAAALGRGTYLEIAGANHFSLAMNAAVREAVVDFIRDRGSAK